MFESLYANEELKANFEKMLHSKTLPHAVLICAEDGLGKGFTARLLAAEYLEPNDDYRYAQVLEGTYPECITVEGEGAFGQIKVEQIRQVRARVQETGFTENGKAVIIKNANRMNSAAANALLKVLEEPPEGVLFILTAPSTGAVLPTILSRCAVFSLSPIPEEVCAKKIKERHPGANAELLSEVFGGRLGLCLNYAVEPERRDMLNRTLQAVKAIARDNIYALAVILSKVEKDKDAAEEMLTLMQFLLLHAAKGKIEKIPTIPTEKLQRVNTAIFDAQQALRQNANTKLTLTALAVSCHT
jgi:DNA polymerase III, gamma/tau subunits